MNSIRHHRILVHAIIADGISIGWLTSDGRPKFALIGMRAGSFHVDPGFNLDVWAETRTCRIRCGAGCAGGDDDAGMNRVLRIRKLLHHTRQF